MVPFRSVTPECLTRPSPTKPLLHHRGYLTSTLSFIRLRFVGILGTDSGEVPRGGLRDQCVVGGASPRMREVKNGPAGEVFKSHSVMRGLHSESYVGYFSPGPRPRKVGTRAG